MKKRKLQFHKPSTIDILENLANEQDYPKCLLNLDKPYSNFLTYLLQNNFFEGTARRTIKEIAKGYHIPGEKATKWIHTIYNDIFKLKREQPELFLSGEPLHILYFKYYDDSFMFITGLKTTPRIYEQLSFYFLKPKMGTYKFWIKNVNHEVWKDKVEISIDLRGGTANQYREQLINKAVFEGEYPEFDLPNMYDFEIDKILKSNYSKI